MCAEALCSSLWGAVAVSILVLGITVALTSLAKSRGQGSGQVVTGAEVTSAPQLPSAEQTAAIIRRRRSIFPKVKKLPLVPLRADHLISRMLSSCRENGTQKVSITDGARCPCRT